MANMEVDNVDTPSPSKKASEGKQRFEVKKVWIESYSLLVLVLNLERPSVECSISLGMGYDDYPINRFQSLKSTPRYRRRQLRYL
jgi:hypothetical protein